FLTLDRLSSYHSLLSITTLTSTVSTIFFFNDTATTEIYTLSLHDALPISGRMTMSYKTVLVALNEINRLDALNTSAVKIAKIDAAFVRGLYTIPAAQIYPSTGFEAVPQMFEGHQTFFKNNLAKVKNAFETSLQKAK